MNELLNTFDTLASLKSNKLEDVGLLAFLVILLTSAVASYVASLLYLYFFRGNSTGSQIHRAFPLLGISITAIFVSIQFSLPLSLGLLGALSIVRFRTPIKEPEEIGFIMLVVALAISCAIFNFDFVLLLLVVSFLVLLVIRLIGFPILPSSRNALIVVTLPIRPQETGVNDITATIQGMATAATLESVSEEPGGGMVLTYRYAGGRALDVDSLVSYFKGIDASATVELYQSPR